MADTSDTRFELCIQHNFNERNENNTKHKSTPKIANHQEL